MMISKSMNAALNQQIANEMNASHSYLAMSYCFMDMGLKVFGKRFAEQATEEREHALKIADYLHETGATVSLEGVGKPKGTYPDAKSIVQSAVESELSVTKQINELVALAEKENDYATRQFLDWFVKEQVEEVSSMTELLQLVTLAGDANLLALENRLAQAMG